MCRRGPPPGTAGSRGEVGEDGRGKCPGLGLEADQLQGLDLDAQEVQGRVLLEEEAPRQPTERRLTLDRGLVRPDQVALHAPRSNEAVKTPKRGIRRWELRLRLICHVFSSFRERPGFRYPGALIGRSERPGGSRHAQTFTHRYSTD